MASGGNPSRDQGGHRFAIGPLTVPIDAEVFAELVRRALPGEHVVYAQGPVALAGHATFTMARRMAEAGLVRTHNLRSETRAGFDFVVVRLADPETPVNDPMDGPRALHADEAALLALLEERADAGGVSPTDGEAATLLGLSRERARYCRGVLVKAGLIRVDAPSRLVRRVVTIVATGKSTVAGAL